MATTRNLGARNLASGNIGDPQRQNNFELEIVALSRDITLNVQSFPLPNESNEVITIARGNSSYKVAGPVTFDAGDMVITDMIDQDTELAIVAWRKTVYDTETEAVGRAGVYKTDATLTQFAPDGTVERQWKFEGVWPSSANYGEMNVESADKKSITVTLEYDRAYRL